ncbi:MAG: CBS domain-containing protein [Thaumarchaeota archaeon]|nr:MAG: CBS domain-containing protein [Nitrososphaerota archaeon]
MLQSSVKKPVSDIMSTKLETIRTSESAKEAAKKMLDKNVSSLVVVDDDGQAIGIVTERDITRGVCIHDVLSKEFKVHHLMTSPLSTIDPNLSVEMAANLMSQDKVRHLIVKEGDKTVGILTATNFIDYLNEQLDPMDPHARVLKTLKDEI